MVISGPLKDRCGVLERPLCIGEGNNIIEIAP